MARQAKSGRRFERGSIAVELGLALPILFFVLLGGLEFGRVLMTRHRLESAVGFAARSAAVTQQIGQAAVTQVVRTQMGNEVNRCSALRIEARQVAQGPGVPSAIEVTATCNVVPMFQIPGFDGVNELRAVSAMPLPHN